MSSPPAAPDRAGVLARGTGACLHLAFWIPLAGCTYLALTPAPPDAVFRISDVILHALAFTYLTFALGLVFATLGNWRIAAWMLGYGALLEFLQSFEPERAAELKDLLMDGAGIAVGLMALRALGSACRRLVHRVLEILLERWY